MKQSFVKMLAKTGKAALAVLRAPVRSIGRATKRRFFATSSNPFERRDFGLKLNAHGTRL
jgi:hypothetical protein